MHTLRLAAAAAAALTVAASSALANEPSPVIFPAQKMPIKFSHKVHIAKKVECDFCHDAAPGSVAASDNLIPGEDACTSCHKIDRADPNREAKPAARCDSCHLYDTGAQPGDPQRVDMPAPNLRFNHKVHADRAIPCQECHGTLAEVDLATRADLPRMPLCLSCHNQISTGGQHEGANKSNRPPVRCANCHLLQGDQTLQTHFATGRLIPSGTLKGDTHTLDFATHHTAVARDAGQYCENCHRKDFCLSCHNGVVKPMSFHGNDYLKIHPIEARKATTNCDGCHRRQSFCLGCHQRAGFTDTITANSPNNLHNAATPQRFHAGDPTRFVGSAATGRTPEHHSWAAMRNIKACVACHREDSCIQCHATAGVTTMGLPQNRAFAVSPHPPGFAGSRQCESLSSKNGRVCLKCHATNDAALRCQ